MDKPTEPPNLERLPKWAQHYIRALDRWGEAQAEVVGALTAEEETPVSFTTHGYRDRRYLPDWSTVRFQPEGKGWIEAMVRKGHLEIQAEWNVAIHPRAANAFTITVDR